MPQVPIASWTYWLLLLEKVIHGAAGGALSVKLTTEVAGITSINWHGLLLGALIGALYNGLVAMGSDAVPGTMNQSLVPKSKFGIPAPKTPRKRRTPRRHPTTSDQTKPPGTV